MCRKVTCRACQKASWKGCGLHVEMVLKDIPENQRCSCEKPDTGSFLSWIFGK